MRCLLEDMCSLLEGMDMCSLLEGMACAVYLRAWHVQST